MKETNYDDTIGGDFFYVKKKDERIWIVVKEGFSEATYGSEKEAIAHIKGFRSGYWSLEKALRKLCNLENEEKNEITK